MVKLAPATPRPRALVLIEPRGAFESVRARPLAVVACTVLLAFSLLPPIAFLASGGDVVAVAKREMLKSGKLDSMPAADREQAMAVVEKIGPLMQATVPVGALVKRALWIGLTALLCFGLLKGSKPELKLGAVVAAVAVASAPLAIHDVVEAATFLASDVMSLPDPQNAVLSNAAAWLRMDTGRSAVAALLRGFDFFDVWSCALIGLGVNAVAGARSSLPYAAAFGLQATMTGLAAVQAAFN